MPFTTIRAIANLTNRDAILSDKEHESRPPILVHPRDVARCEIVVPWCTSSGEFPTRHLRVEFYDPRNGGGTLNVYSVWQQNISGTDLVRYSGYTPPPPGQDLRIDPPYRQNAPALADSRIGGAYSVYGDSSAVLVINEEAWVILVRIMG
jgi:hypothetical protein